MHIKTKACTDLLRPGPCYRLTATLLQNINTFMLSVIMSGLCCHMVAICARSVIGICRFVTVLASVDLSLYRHL